MTLKLLAPVDRVIVKEITVEKKTTGGIILTESAGDPNNTARKGEIISSGLSSNGLEVGTVIYFGKHSGNTIQHEDQIYVSLVQHDIVGVISQ